MAARSLARNHADGQSTYAQPIYSSLKLQIHQHYLRLVLALKCSKSQNWPSFNWTQVLGSDLCLTMSIALASLVLRLAECDPGLC